MLENKAKIRIAKTLSKLYNTVTRYKQIFKIESAEIIAPAYFLAQ